MSFLDELAYPPSGGRVKQILLGLIIPAAIGYFAYHAWNDQKALWFGKRGGSYYVYGEAAKAMAACYLAPALYCHFRWFWGMVPVYKLFEIGVILSILLFLGGFGATCYYVFR